MTCPKCFGDNTLLIGDTHYVCNNPNCVDEHGKRTQFRFVQDEKIRFPYNQIFLTRSVSEFYKKPYLELNAVGLSEV